MALSHTVSEWQSDKCRGVGRQFCLIFATKFLPLKVSEKRRSDWSSAIQYLPYGAKIVKIGLADPEIFRLRANESGTKQNWLSWQRPLRNWKKWTWSRKFTQIPSIWWKDRENRSSRYWDSFAWSKKEEEITEGKIYSPVGKFAERAKLKYLYRMALLRDPTFSRFYTITYVSKASRGN